MPLKPPDMPLKPLEDLFLGIVKSLAAPKGAAKGLPVGRSLCAALWFAGMLKPAISCPPAFRIAAKGHLDSAPTNVWSALGLPVLASSVPPAGDCIARVENEQVGPIIAAVASGSKGNIMGYLLAAAE
jgi:hypothetical protein